MAPVSCKATLDWIAQLVTEGLAQVRQLYWLWEGAEDVNTLLHNLTPISPPPKGFTELQGQERM